MPDIQRPHYLSRAEAATYLCVSVPTLARWASLNIGPRYYRLGRNARYLQVDLDAFAESRRSDSYQNKHLADAQDLGDTGRVV